MGSPQPKAQYEPLIFFEDYLAKERVATERHEYLNCRIIAMAGESPAHADMSANASGSLVTQLRGKRCRARIKDTKVRSGLLLKSDKTARGLFSYPDILVICGEPEYDDVAKDVVLNPTTIVEVLSPSTEAFDRGEEFASYQRWNPSLQEDVLISQSAALIEVFSKKKTGVGWDYRIYEGLDAIVELNQYGRLWKRSRAASPITISADSATTELATIAG